MGEIKLLTPEQRGEVIDDIVARLRAKGSKTEVEEGITNYGVNFSVCGIQIDDLDGAGNPLVQVVEHFADPYLDYEKILEPDFLAPPQGIRRVYRGSTEGLHEIGLQAIFSPSYMGKILPFPEKVLRDRGGITNADREHWHCISW